MHLSVSLEIPLKDFRGQYANIPKINGEYETCKHSMALLVQEFLYSAEDVHVLLLGHKISFHDFLASMSWLLGAK